VLPLVRVTVLAASALSTGGPPATPTPVPAATPSCIHALAAPTPAVYRPGTCPDPGSVPHGDPTWCTVPVVAGGLAACDPARAPRYGTVPAGR